MLAAGTEIAGWRVERLLARGGMGFVYLARHPRLPRQDALKILDEGLSHDDGFRSRFLLEADRASKLASHPNIVTIHDRGEDQGRLYIAMQYVTGGDLRALLNQSRLSSQESLHVAMQVASALDAAHAVGIVHRDVKPENVLLWSRREDEPLSVVLSDFGISRLADGTSHLTTTGHAMFTAKYASPEQLKGEPVDGRADQYALACLLFEALAGSAPMARTDLAATITAHLTEPPPKPSLYGLPAAVDAIFAQAMAKVPDERYATCARFVQEVRTALVVPDESTQRQESLGHIGENTLPRETVARVPDSPEATNEDVVASAGRSPRRRRQRIVMGIGVLVVGIVAAGITIPLLLLGGDPALAATVGRHHIEAKELRDVTNRGTSNAAVQTFGDKAGLQRRELTLLIRRALIDDLAARMHVSVTDQQVAAVRKNFAKQAGDDDAFVQQAAQSGVSRLDLPATLHDEALGEAITKALTSDSAKGDAAYAQALQKQADIDRVQVKREYGSWDRSTVSIIAYVKPSKHPSRNASDNPVGGGSAGNSKDFPAVSGATDLKTRPVVQKGIGSPPGTLVTKDLVIGTGAVASAANTVSVRYVGVNYVDGKEFDSSWASQGSRPVDFPLASVIQGFTQGIVGMQVGGRREIVIPPSLAYGTQGSGAAIVPDETLVFVVDLVKIS